jgi:pyruvate formate lyase activating enzyme
MSLCECAEIHTAEESGPTGVLFNIQRYSIHDGPGIRTVVFLKGCLLRCIWCCNPESQLVQPEFAFYPSRCIGCLACVQACDRKAIRVLEDGTKLIDRQKCDFDAKCVDRCYAEALVLFGKRYSVNQLLKEVEVDRPFYDRSGGGVTLSGGDPLAQVDFAAGVLQECKRKGINTAIETCGWAHWDAWLKLLPYTDLVLYDIKHMDSAAHQKLVGVPNGRIIDNALRLVRLGKNVIPRFPIVPGCNDDERNIVATGRFVADALGVKEIHLLPYHRLGQDKYQYLCKAYKLHGNTPFSIEQVQRFKRLLEGCGLEVVVGG